MEPLFPDNWREQVRAFLAPFEIECVWPNNQRSLSKKFLAQVSCYDLQTVSAEYNEGNTFEGIFTLGTGSLFVIATLSTPNSEETMTCLWADKTIFATPLQFWAGANLVLNYFQSMWQDAEPNIACIHFGVEPIGSPIEDSHPRFSVWPKYLWPHQRDSTPQITQEIRMRGWKIADEWYEIGELLETEQSYFIQQWDTTA